MSGAEEYLGLNIDKICGNGFDDPALNHCAHFASHALDFRFPYSCKQATGGTERGANVRVHEIFARCAAVGPWPAPDGTGPTLIFVTARRNVDLDAKQMANVPRKHIGVFENGCVYHYSNTRDQVVKQTVAEFQKAFDKVYGGPQGYFWGRPSGQTQPSVSAATPQTAGPQSTAPISFGRESDAKGNLFAICGDERFYVGTPTQQFRGGLYQRETLLVNAPRFRAADYRALGQWAELLELTGHCEAKNRMTCINTYDRAGFTYGFYQLAAHTPNDNLILLMRRLPGLTTAKAYVPQLGLNNGKLTWNNTNGSSTDLDEQGLIDNETQNVALKRFLNPRQPEIDDAEFDWAARLIHWTLHDPALRKLQVDISASVLRGKVCSWYDKWYDLDGESDAVIAVVSDIHHNGRAKKVAVKTALSITKSGPRLDALIDISSNPDHATRQTALRSKLKAMIDAGRLGTLKWSSALQDFVDPNGKPIA